MKRFRAPSELSRVLDYSTRVVVEPGRLPSVAGAARAFWQESVFGWSDEKSTRTETIPGATPAA